MRETSWRKDFLRPQFVVINSRSTTKVLHVKISVNGSLCSKTEIIGQRLFLVKEKSMSHSSVFPTN